MDIANPVLDFIQKHIEYEAEPYYVYDTQKIRKQCRRFQNLSYPEKSVHFATMANIHPRFLQIVKEENIRVFVNSILHLEAVMQAGFKAEEIVFTSSGLAEKTMTKIANYGVRVNVDSPMQLAKWQQLFPGKRVGIRCNIGNSVCPFSTHAGYFIGENSRLGFTEDEIKDIADTSKISGLHLYAGTDIFDVDYLLECYSALIRLADYFPALDHLNMGGGFGVPENGGDAFDFAEYDRRLSELMHLASKKANRKLKLILEPGRIIGGEAGFFVCSVTDIKSRNDRRLIGVNASTVQFPRPLLYPDTARHPVTVLRNGIPLEGNEKVDSTIFGCSTYSRDVFRNQLLLPRVEPGDTIVFGNAGSYSAYAYLHFLGFPKPEEFFV